MKTPEEVLAEIQTFNAKPTRSAFNGGRHGPMVIKALDAAGYVIVPKEPTKEMLEAAWSVQAPVESEMTEIYRAMIAAAQTQETRQSED